MQQQGKSWRPTFLTLAVIAVAVLVVYAVVRKKMSVWSRKSSIRANCRSATRDVTVLAHLQRTNGIAFVKRVFASAFCPFRVRVRLFVGGISAKTLSRVRVLDLLREESLADPLLRPFADLVDVVQTPDASRVSPLEALEILTRGMHPRSSSRSFAFAVNERAHFQRDWDKDLITLHVRRSASNVVLTCVPPPKPLSMTQRHARTSSAVFQQIQKLAVPQNLPIEFIEAVAQFPVCTWKKGGPAVVGRTLPRIFRQPLPACVASSQHLFCTASVMKEALEAIPEEVLQACRSTSPTDYVLSAALHYHGCRIEAVCRSTIAMESFSGATVFPRCKRLRERLFKEDLKEYLADYNNFVGVDANTKTVYGRARMGLAPNPTNSQILSMYRSQREFERVKESISGYDQ